MPSYRIHRLKDSVHQQFRFAPHVSGAAVIKERDYEPSTAIDAPTPYAAFFAQRDMGSALLVGDVLETETGELRIFKYVGFEEARWFVPEPKAEEVLVQGTSV
jgi:hypothetical protein